MPYLFKIDSTGPALEPSSKMGSVFSFPDVSGGFSKKQGPPALRPASPTVSLTTSAWAPSGHVGPPSELSEPQHLST